MKKKKTAAPTPCSAMTASIYIESFDLSMIDQSAPCADLSQICIGGIDYANTAGDIVLDLKNFADKKIIVSDPSKLPKLGMITIMNADTTLTPSLLESIPKLTQLTTLAIQNGNLQNLPSFTSSVNLSTLSLAGNNISDINTSFLNNFPNLYNLDLTNNPKTCALTNPKACLKCPPTLPNKIHCKHGVS
jgi:Leucine-rich repeat (LRR) protein